ncbi:MAG: DUF4115 domain-containing protein [Kiloniellaceae bacterium]
MWRFDLTAARPCSQGARQNGFGDGRLGKRGDVGVNHEPISRAEPGGTATDRRTGVGGLLRASRLRCGEELEVISDVLRIRRRHLQAIEDGDFDQLPGTTYAVGFIRAYADYLGLDAEEVVRRFKEEQTLQPGRPPKADLIFPSPMSETGIPRGAVVFLGVVIGVIAYGGWYSSTVDNDFFKQWIEPVPARLMALMPGDAREDLPDRSQAVAADKPMSRASIPNSDAAPENTPPENAMSAPMTREPAQVTAETSAMPSSESSGAETQPTMTTDMARPEEAGAPEPIAESSPETVVESTSDAITNESAAAGNASIGAVENAEPATPVTETADATPAPEPIAPATNQETVETPVETVRPPASIAQPVETAQLPAPDAAAPTSVESAAVETAGGQEDAQPTMSTDETAAAPPATTEVASTPAEVADARIVLTAISDSWVEVREMGTDAWIWGKLLRSGETYAVPDRPDLKLKTGNAGGLTIAVDGTGVPPVGASGEVVRNVLLDPDRLKAGTAVFR